MLARRGTVLLRRSPLTALLLLCTLAACGGSSHRANDSTSRPRATTTTESSTTTSSTTVSTTTVAPSSAPATSSTTVAPTTTAPRVTSPPPTAAPLLVTRLTGVGNAQQVVSVTTEAYGSSDAVLRAFQRTSSGWQLAFGPWSARIGRNGFAPPGAKREGDGRTPSGAYGFSFFFGVLANPGVHFPFRSIPGSWIVWDDDPGSPNYNLWIDTRSQSAGANPEPMHVSAYNYGAVIAYNTARTPGLGSAIFFHVSDGSSTAGCVSLPTSELLSVLRWLDPNRAPRIIMGPIATVTS